MEDIASLLQFKLKAKTSPLWAKKVLESFDVFLLDHAAAEKKAMSTCLSMIAKYPHRTEIIPSMFNIAKEELEHYEEVAALIYQRGLLLKNDEKDFYIHTLLKAIRNSPEEHFLDRLLIAAIIENRGCERFSLVAEALEESDPLRLFYQRLSVEEAKHYGQYIKLARIYFSEADIRKRLDELLSIEAKIVEELPITPMLH
jgi:tRNA-(ms[2]io[6]A)-hydroxylase